MASIQKRGKNSYRIVVSLGYDRSPSNKKITESITVKIDPSLTPSQAEKEVEKIAWEFEQRVKRGIIIDATTTFKEFAQRWLVEYAERNLEKSTLESYRSELETKIYPALGHVKLSDLKTLHLIRFYEALTKNGVRRDNKPGGYSTRVIKYQHSIISSILNTAVYWQVINDNIALKVNLNSQIITSIKQQKIA